LYIWIEQIKLDCLLFKFHEFMHTSSRKQKNVSGRNLLACSLNFTMSFLIEDDVSFFQNVKSTGA
jgi:hypothetical protein